jgi:hypothetical protein
MLAMVGKEVPHFCAGQQARPAVFRLRPCVRLLGLYLRALGSLPLVFSVLVCGSWVLVCWLVFMLSVYPILSFGKHQPMSRDIFECFFEA